MVVGRPATPPSVTLCGRVVPVRTSARYLGFDLCMAARGKSLVVNVANTVRSFFAASNSIIGILQCASPLTRAHLLKVFAVPLVDYALQLYDFLPAAALKMLTIAGDRVARRACGLHSRCSSNLARLAAELSGWHSQWPAANRW